MGWDKGKWLLPAFLSMIRDPTMRVILSRPDIHTFAFQKLAEANIGFLHLLYIHGHDLHIVDNVLVTHDSWINKPQFMAMCTQRITYL